MARTSFSGPVKSDNGFEGNITGNVTGNVAGNVAGFVTPPEFTLSSLPTNADYADGTLIYVSDATNVGSGTGTICFNNGTDWIDISTGIAVA
jgi:hypothetical protein